LPSILKFPAKSDGLKMIAASPLTIFCAHKFRQSNAASKIFFTIYPSGDLAASKRPAAKAEVRVYLVRNVWCRNKEVEAA
jgi:hypothetical protein